MAAINLSSLATFWNSAKDYISTHFLKKPVLLGYVVEQSSITLSVDVRTYSKIIVVMQTNDNIYFESAFSTIGPFPSYGVSVNTDTASPTGWLKLVRLNISSDGKTISVAGTNEIAFKSGGIGVGSATIYIRDVWGVL